MLFGTSEGSSPSISLSPSQIYACFSIVHSSHFATHVQARTQWAAFVYTLYLSCCSLSPPLNSHFLATLSNRDYKGRCSWRFALFVPPSNPLDRVVQPANNVNALQVLGGRASCAVGEVAVASDEERLETGQTGALVVSSHPQTHMLVSPSWQDVGREKVRERRTRSTRRRSSDSSMGPSRLASRPGGRSPPTVSRSRTGG